MQENKGEQKKILRKKYAWVRFRLISSLMLGSGDNSWTDKDLMKNSRGIPYIPASSIAGVIRDAFSKDEQEEYFGYVDIRKAENDKEGGDDKTVEKQDKSSDDNIENKMSESRVLFYDANLVKEDEKKYHTSIRDSVALDKYKTAIKGAKFDMEVLEPGVSFETYLEQNFYAEDDEDYIDKIVNCFNQGLCFGGKSMRGYGDIVFAEAKHITFSMDSIEDIGGVKGVNSWLSFNLFSEKDDGWEDYSFSDKEQKETVKRRLEIPLKQEGGISIRRYTTAVADGETMPDMEQMTSHGYEELTSDNVCEQAVIPGTSWAGAFRHRMKEFGITVDGKESIFGYLKGEGKDQKARSKIRFGESRIKGGFDKKLSRNAIDRFTGGTVDGALFTEKTHYGGTTELVIEWVGDKDMKDMPDRERSALAAAITDLHFGFLAVGGETSIGRGLFSIADNSLRNEIFVEKNKNANGKWDEGKEASVVFKWVKEKVDAAFGLSKGGDKDGGE